MKNPLGMIRLYLPNHASLALDRLTPSERQSLREIRIKCGYPTLFLLGKERRVCGEIHTKEEIDVTFRKICASSSYTHRNEIRAGYVTLPGGHRVGIVGSAVLGEGGKVEGMRDIMGFSFRVARDCSVQTSEILSLMRQGGRLRSGLLVGPPCSGKTTFLRAVARVLSEREQVCVVDEREELFPTSAEPPIGCDVLRGYPKAPGILQALRTLSPSVILCDEIGTSEEVDAMADGLRSGVALLSSAHAHNAEELVLRPPIRRLIEVGGVDFAVFLDSDRPGTVVRTVERKELYDEISRVDDRFYGLRRCRSDLSV